MGVSTLLAWVDATGAMDVGMPAHAVFTTEGLAPQMARRTKNYPQSRTVPQDNKRAMLKFSGQESTTSDVEGGTMRANKNSLRDTNIDNHRLAGFPTPGFEPMKMRAGMEGTMDRCQVPSRQDVDQSARSRSSGQEKIAAPVDKSLHAR
jgi:hypothetical protein